MKACRDQLIKQGVDLSQYNSARSAGDMEALGGRATQAVLQMCGRRGMRGQASAAPKPISGRIPRLRQQPLSTGDERFNDNRVVGFIHDWLFSHLRVPLGHRVQNLLTYIDAAARGDGALLLEIQQSLAKEEAAQRKKAKEEDAKVGTPYPDPFPVEEGKYQMGQGLSIDCYEEKAFESMDEDAQAMAKSEIVRALLGADGGVGNFKTCALWPSGRADLVENAHVDYDGPQLAFTGELDASLSGLAGYKIAMLYANATNVAFGNAGHIKVHMDDAYPSRDYNYYRPCASGLARQFLADPQQSLDTRCAETQKLRLVH